MSLHHVQSVVAQLALRLEHDAALAVSHLQVVCVPVPRRCDVWLVAVLLDVLSPFTGLEDLTSNNPRTPRLFRRIYQRTLLRGDATTCRRGGGPLVEGIVTRSVAAR